MPPALSLPHDATPRVATVTSCCGDRSSPRESTSSLGSGSDTSLPSNPQSHPIAAWPRVYNDGARQEYLHAEKLPSTFQSTPRRTLNDAGTKKEMIGKKTKQAHE
ncbi:unnamed protein product [Ectocarpus sp. 8 AP-2014]